MPPCTEPNDSIISEDLFTGSSLIDLLQPTPDVNMSCFMADDEPLGLTPMLPMMTSELSPTGGSVNVLDMINQDVLLGNNYQSTLSSASTEVTYVSQYAASSATPFCSAAPFTSAGDVFLPSMSVTTASNTFVKPLHTYVPPSGRNARTILKPSPRPAYRPANFRNDNPNIAFRPAYPKPVYLSSPNPFVVNAIVPNLTPIARKPITFTETTSSKSEKSRKSSKKSSSNSSKKSKSRSHGSHKRSSRSKSSKKSSHSRCKSESILSIGSTRQSAFVPTSPRSLVRSTAVTHTVTRPANTVTESTVTKAIATVTYATSTVAHTLGQHAAAHAWSALRTATVTSYTATKTQVPATGSRAKCTYDSFLRSVSTTSTITSYTRTKPRMPATIISPMQSTYLPANFHSGPTIISRNQPSTAGGARPAQTTYVIPVSASTEADATPRLRARFMIPATNTCTTATESIVSNAASATTKHRVTRQYGRTTRSAHVLTNVHTYVTSTTTATTTAPVASRTLTQSTFALPPGATFYTAKKIATTKGTTRSRTASTPEPQTFTIVDGKGSFTTLTLSPDFTTTTGSPLIVAHTQTTTAGTAGIGLRTSPITTEAVIVPQNQYLFPIANSQMSPSTSLGYLVTSPIGSDIIATRNSAVVSPQNAATTTATAIGSHTITTISSEAFNRIRNRLFCNVSSTGAGLSSQSPSTVPADRTRGPVTIITNHLLSPANQRDGSATLSTAASNATTPTRTLLTAAPTQGLFAFTAPVTTHSSSATADTAGRLINRMVVMSNMHVSSNNQSSAPTQGTYILRTGISSSDSTTTSSRDTCDCTLHTPNTTTDAMTSTTVATTFVRSSSRDVSGSAYLSSIDSSEVHSKLRSRLTVPVTSTEGSMPGTPTHVTTHTYSRSRPSNSLYAVPGATIAFTSSTRTSEGTTRCPGTMTLIRFTPSTSANVPTTISAHRLRASPALPTPATLSSMTTATPILTNTGNRYIIKLDTTPSVTNVSSVTTAVTTPITTAAISPPEHQFLEPHPMPSRLRTFPGPRTYPVAHRLAAGNMQRPPARSLNPRPKKIISNPAPLQIFADVVNPRTTAQNHTPTTATQGCSRSRNSNVVVPQYKTAVFKNLSTVAHSERVSSRLVTPSSDRIVLNRSLTFLSPRHSSPSGQTVAQSTPTTTMITQRMPRLVRATHLETRSQVVRDTLAAPESALTSKNPRFSPVDLDLQNE